MSNANTTAWRQRAERCDDRVRELRAEITDMVPRDWHGLMAILDYAYPAEIFPISADAMERDPGPRIVSLVRYLDQARTRIAAVRAVLDKGGAVVFADDIREALDAS